MKPKEIVLPIVEKVIPFLNPLSTRNIPGFQIKSLGRHAVLSDENE
jgi:hypothetical protein